ncbi:hypothetical protein K2Y11_06000 [bacterium]|nr:hypothetical protein [bacterium]
MDAATTNTTRRQRLDSVSHYTSGQASLPLETEWSSTPIARAWHRFHQNTAALAGSTVTLMLMLIGIRLWTSPYGGFVHDAQLYSIQALHRSSGNSYARDLFFLFGSQDEYSAFSPIMSPLVALLGLSAAFFTGYLVSLAVFLLAQISIVTQLITDRFLAVITLIVLTVCGLPYGGWSIFNVNEPFLTARLPATAIALLGIAQLLKDRPARAWLCLLLAMTIHPLMALPGIGLIGCWHLSKNKPRWIRSFAALGAVLGVIGAAAFMATGRMKYMDHDWVAIVQAISPQCFPSDWLAEDWVNILFTSAILLVASFTIAPRFRWLPASALTIGVGGLLLSLVAELFPIPVVLQSQPMRSLWLVEFFAVALAPLVAYQQWGIGGHGGKLLAILLTVWICRLRPPYMWDESFFWMMTAGMIALAVFAVNIFSTKPNKGNARWSAAFIAVIGSCGISAIANTAACVQSIDQLAYMGDAVTLASIAIRIVGDFLPLVIAAALTLLVTFHQGNARSTLMRAGSIALLALLFNGWSRTSTDAVRDAGGLAFIREVTKPNERIPNIYWPTDIRNIWFGIPATSYYHFVQVQGAIFRRDTAIEAKRRIDLVRPFEMRELRSLGPFIPWERLGRVYGPTEKSRPVSPADVLALANEADLDFIVLPYEVPTIPSSTRDGVWIYDCAQLRKAQRTIHSAQVDSLFSIPTEEH